MQTNDFTPGFRTNALKLVVLITDAPPGGFCDPQYYAWDPHGVRAQTYALDARTNCVRINAIQVKKGDETLDPGAKTVMTNYYQISCGWYSNVPHDGSGIAEAVAGMLYVAGYCNCQ